MKEISFEMARELGLIPKSRERYLTFSFPFESRYAYEKRCEVGEIGYRAEMKRLKEDYKVVNFNGEQFLVS